MKTQQNKLTKIGMILLMAVASVVNTENANGQTLWAPGGTVGTSPNLNVGIGVNNPAFKLQVVPSTTGNSGIGIYNGGTGGAEVRFQSSVVGSHSYGINNCGSTPDATLLGNFGIYDYTDAAYRLMIKSNGNVGINSKNPQATFHIGLISPDQAALPTYTAPNTITGPDVNLEGLSIQTYTNNGDNYRRYVDFVALGYNNGSAGGSSFRFLTNNMNSGTTPAAERMRIDNDGNVGIATNSPCEKLSVAGSIAVDEAGTNNGTILNTLKFGSCGTGEGIGSNRNPVTGTPGFSSPLGFGNDLEFFTASTRRMLITNDGKVAIGNVVPNKMNNSYKLWVSGGIETNALLIKNYTSWPDYVFADNYHLKSLDEVEVYINENNHLPGIPSAKEIYNEGIEIGAMQTKQMEKIEELTLYMIEMKKEIQSLKEENASMKSSITYNKN